MGVWVICAVIGGLFAWIGVTMASHALQLFRNNKELESEVQDSINIGIFMGILFGAAGFLLLFRALALARDRAASGGRALSPEGFVISDSKL